MGECHILENERGVSLDSINCALNQQPQSMNGDVPNISSHSTKSSDLRAVLCVFPGASDYLVKIK